MRGTQLSDYDYELPSELIAKYPSNDRDQSRLLVVSRSGKNSKHLVFTDVLGLLRPGDVVVINDTKVIPSRLVGRKPTGAHCEVLLLKPWVGKADCPTSFSNVIKSRSFFESQIWEALVRPGGKLKPGRIVEVGDDLQIEILEYCLRNRFSPATVSHQTVPIAGHIAFQLSRDALLQQHLYEFSCGPWRF